MAEPFLWERAASLIRKGNGKGPNVNEERAWEALLLKGCTRFFQNFTESLSHGGHFINRSNVNWRSMQGRIQ